MENFDGQKAFRTSLQQRRVLIGIVLTLLILVASITFLRLYMDTSTHGKQPKMIQPKPYSVHRSEEIPASAHHAQSMAATEQATTLMPWSIALDNVHGFVWVAEPGCNAAPTCPSKIPGIIGQYALSDGNFIQDFKEPGGYSSPLFVSVDMDGHIWFTQPDSDAIGEFDPQNMIWNQWSVKRGSIPYDLTFDTHGNIWFTEFGTNNIGFFNTHTHTLVENPIPTANSEPYGITVDPKGTIWFAENRLGLGQIGSFTPTSSGTIKITEYAVGAIRPHLITIDRAGNIWYSGGYSGYIGEFNPTTGSSNNFFVSLGPCSNTVTCTATHISGIQVDNEGNVWFSDTISQRIGYLIPSTGEIVARTLEIAENPHPADGLIVDSSDRVWFIEQFALTLNMWPASAVKQKSTQEP
jgi:virginiamycin B lyase